jgi:capsular polysaccharide biosynthesis protein
LPVTDPAWDVLKQDGHDAPIVIEPASTVPRTPFVFNDEVDNTLSPYGWFFNDPKAFKFSPAPVRAIAFGRAHVCGVDGIVICKDGIIRETLKHIAHWRADSGVASFGADESCSFRDDLTFPASVNAGEYVGIKGGWFNYAHWMCEAVPRLVVYQQMLKSRPGLKVILPEFDRGSFQDLTLSLLGIDESRIFRIQPKHMETFERLYVVFGIDLFSISPLMAHAAWLMRTAYAAQQPQPNAPAGRRRIYIHRGAGTSRRVANFDKVRPVLESMEFSIVEFEDTSLFEQIETMRNAAIVIAEHGAGAANLMFCQPGTLAVELFNPACVQPAHWSLASRCGMSYGYMIGEHFPGPDGDAPLSWNSDYTIHPKRLRKALRQHLETKR